MKPRQLAGSERYRRRCRMRDLICTTFHCCGFDLTMNCEYDQGGAFRCPTCQEYLWGKLKGSIINFGGDANA